MAYKKWVVRDADKDKASMLSEKFNIDPFIAFLLASRGIDDELSVSSFLSDSFETVSPFAFADMDVASFVIGDAIDNGEKICIYGDYDCDGVTSTALLYTYLVKEGANVCYYIPNRDSEGYGLNSEAVKKISAMGVNLIITVDNGINAFDEAELIYSLGMRLVVTDHHQVGEKLPRAEAVVNPHRVDNNLKFKDYCGVGVAFKLITALNDGDVNSLLDDYIDLVAIGTIADVMPLVYENRAFVRAGLNKINNNPRPSIKAFLDLNKSKKLTSTDVAFQICPRINAMGRMGDATRGVEFLISEDSDDCSFKCEQLNLENTHRQQVEKDILDDVENKISQNPKLLMDRVVVIAGENYHSGVIGIVASHILQKYGKPTIIITICDDGLAHGSARSIDGFNIYDAINACSGDLVRFGGHPMAAGITLNAQQIDAFRQNINAFAYEKYLQMPAVQLQIDCKLSPFYLNLDLVNNLSSLEPYGEGNPQPLFCISKMRLLSVTPLKEGKHIRLELEKKGRKIKVVKFNTNFDDFEFLTGDLLNIVVKVSKSVFNEKTYLSVQAVDIKLANADDEKYFSEKNTYDLFKQVGKFDSSLYPNRDDCAVVYKFLKTNNGYNYSNDSLYFRLQNKITYGKLMFALKAFSQSGLITITNKIVLNKTESKVKLEETPILKSLKERL